MPHSISAFAASGVGRIWESIKTRPKVAARRAREDFRKRGNVPNRHAHQRESPFDAVGNLRIVLYQKIVWPLIVKTLLHRERDAHGGSFSFGALDRDFAVVLRRDELAYEREPEAGCRHRLSCSRTAERYSA